jgi:hypothetical protein
MGNFYATASRSTGYLHGNSPADIPWHGHISPLLTEPPLMLLTARDMLRKYDPFYSTANPAWTSALLAGLPAKKRREFPPAATAIGALIKIY